MALKFRRGTTAQQSGSLAFGEPFVNTTLGTLLVGGATGDIVLSVAGTGSTGTFGAISGSGLDITGNANIAGNLTLGGTITIGDASTDNVVVNADLSSSIIPNNDNAFDLGSGAARYRAIYGTNIYGAINATNGVVSGSSQVTLQSTTGFTAYNTALSTITGSLISTASANTISITNINSVTASALTRLTALEVETSNLETFSSSALTRLTALEVETSNLETFSGSQLSKDSTLATYTGSNDTKWSTLGSLSGSFARTNSANTFSGNQTVSGSLYITQDLVVQGSSSIQNVSSSTLNIGTNLITVAVNQPSVRFGGFAVVDSGSAGASGSFLYDSVQDEFIFVHRGNGTNVTSSHFILGPETIDNLGNETYLTNNRLSKGTGKEHLVDSNITDTGTLITLGSNAVVNGTFYATGATLVSGSSQIDATTTTNWATGIKTRLDANTVVSGSSQVIGILSSLNSYTASNDTTNTTQTSRLDQLSTASGSAITRLTTLEVETANLETFSSSALTRLTALEVETANLESFTSSINTTIKTRLNAETVVSGSSQITLSSTTGYGTVINQNLLTTSNVQHASLGIGMAASGTAGRIDATNDIVAFSSSDIRFKENIKPIENAIDKIRKISGNTYDWKEENKIEHGYEGNDVGVIAQEIEAVLPQLVQTRESGFKAVKYDKLVALLIEGIKEQQLQIEQLRIDLNNCNSNKGL